MMQKCVKKYRLQDVSEQQHDLAFWLTKSPEERVAAVEYLRRIHHGGTPRLQRRARVVQHTPR
jgi:hypothetical protein